MQTFIKIRGKQSTRLSYQTIHGARVRSHTDTVSGSTAISSISKGGNVCAAYCDRSADRQEDYAGWPKKSVNFDHVASCDDNDDVRLFQR